MLRAAQADYDRLRDEVRQSVAAASPPVVLTAAKTLSADERHAVASEKVGEILACMRAAKKDNEVQRWEQLNEAMDFATEKIDDPDTGEKFLSDLQNGLGGQIDAT